jgi:non-specific serine/threonine protein kinase
LKRLDEKTDKWAPRYMTIADSLLDYTNLNSQFVVKISDLDADKFNLIKWTFLTPRTDINQDLAFKSDNVSKSSVTSVGLRAPKLILKVLFDHSIDIWRFGCLVYELLTETSLFSVINIEGQNLDSCDDDHLLRMTDYLGSLLKRLTARWSRSFKYFRDDDELFNIMISWSSSIIDLFEPLKNLFRQNKSDEIEKEEKSLMLNLLRHVLRYEPEKRSSTENLLKHSWFQSDV